MSSLHANLTKDSELPGMPLDTELPLESTFSQIWICLDTTLLTCLVLQAPPLVIDNSMYLVQSFHSSLACQGYIILVFTFPY